MPEGHTIHRAALDQQDMLVDKIVTVSSPQGRFSSGAGHINRKKCKLIEACGKHLIYGFSGGNFLHIHLGLAGRIMRQPLPAPPERDAIRVRLMSKSHVVDVSGPAICELLDKKGYQDLIDRIGPDVLRSDADPQKAFHKIKKSKAAIGTLLMNQAVIAGVGNIYRTEILWLLGIHPLKLGREIDEKTFMQIWSETKRLMRIGVKYNTIITNAYKPKGKYPYDSQVNIYGEEKCPKCSAKIRSEKLAARTVYFCPKCQA